MTTLAPATRATDLVPWERLRSLTTRRDGPALRRLALHLAVIAAGMVAIAAARGTWWILPAWVATGVVVAHLFALQHEATHRTAFASRRANRVCATVCGAALGIAPGLFRLEHLAHHAYTQDPERDPELLAAPASVGAWLWQLGTAPFWAYQARTLWAHATGRLLAGEERWIPERHRAAVRTEARWMLGGWAVLLVVPVLLGHTEVLVYWVIPRLLGEPVMRVARLAEHAGRPLGPDVTTNTRTLDVIRPLRYLAWNMPLHAEHHAMPAVPFHALPDLRRVLAGRLAGPHGGYIDAHRELLAATRGRAR